MNLIVLRHSVVCFFIFGLASTRGQVTTATMYGSILDPSGGVIPGALITLAHEETGTTVKRTSSDGGEFVFDFLHVGHYRLTIQAQGFKRYERAGINLTAGQSIRDSFALEVGNTTETMTVQGEAPLVNTVSAEQLQTFESQKITELPLARRNFSSILRVGSGVSGSAGSIRLNGVGRNGTGYSVDGTEAASDPEGRGSQTFSGGNYVDLLSIESIQEVAVVKGILAAEYGGAIGGQVNVVTRSGTNQWHGSLFENFQAENLNARPAFLTTAPPPYTYNQFGGSTGGPIRKDRIFVFGAFEGYRQTQVSVLQGDMPTQATRDLVIQSQPSYAAPLSYLPLPNQPLSSPAATTGRVITTGLQRRRDNHVDVKSDLRLTNTKTLALTYSRGRPFTHTPRIQLNGSYDQDLQVWTERATAAYVMSGPSWTSETRFGYNLNDATRVDGIMGIPAPENPTEVTEYGRRLGAISTNLGWSTPGGEIVVLEGPTWSLGEKFARHVGKHSVKFGGQYTHRCCRRLNTEAVVWSYTGLDDLLANIPSTVNASFGGGDFKARMFEYGFFIQDDWRVTANLTLNMGLRYDFFSNVVAQPDRDSESRLYNADGLLDHQFNIGPIRDPNNPYDHDAINFAPRFGFSYNVGGKGKTVVRGGFGTIFTPQTMGSVWQSAQNRYVPKRVIFSRADAIRLGIKYPMYNDDLRVIADRNARELGQTNLFNIINPHLQDPYTMHFTLGLQRELTSSLMLETAFVGNRGNKQPLFRWGNEVDRITGIRPNPNLSMQYYIDESATSSYFSWQTSARKRYSRNLTGSVHYTWGKALSIAGGDPGAYYQGDNASRNQEFFDLSRDKGPSSGDLKHYFASEWIYDVPQLSRFSNPIVRHAAGGWQVSGILIATSGSAIYIAQVGSARQINRPDYVGGEAVNADWRKTLAYLNRDSFALVPINAVSRATVRPGNLGNAPFRGPGSWTVDLGLGKNFPIRERVRLQIRADMFNAFNHVNYSNPNTTITGASFGLIQGAGSMRVVQLNGRIRW